MPPIEEIEVDMADLPLLLNHLDIQPMPRPRPRSAGRMMPGSPDMDMWAHISEKLVREERKKMKAMHDHMHPVHPCQEDTLVHCAHAATISHCLSEHHKDLSEPCRQQVQKTLPHICHKEVDKFCDVFAEGIYPCLARNRGNLSNTCRDVFTATEQNVTSTPKQDIQVLAMRNGTMSIEESPSMLSVDRTLEMVPYAAPVFIIAALVTMSWLSVGRNMARVFDVTTIKGLKPKKEAVIKSFECSQVPLGGNEGEEHVQLRSESTDEDDVEQYL